jgi:hypothetical protein
LWEVDVENVGGCEESRLGVEMKTFEKVPVTPVILSGAEAGVPGFDLPAGLNKEIITKVRPSY